MWTVRVFGRRLGRLSIYFTAFHDHQLDTFALRARISLTLIGFVVGMLAVLHNGRVDWQT